MQKKPVRTIPRSVKAGPLVLIVNDESNLSADICSMLKRNGCRTETVSSGEDAVERVRRTPSPDLVLLDMGLPGMDGLETLKRLRQAQQRAKIVMLTSAVDPRKVVRAVRLGAYDCLGKPCRKSALEALVHECVIPDEEENELIVKEDLGDGSFFVAASPAMRKLHALVAEVAPTDVPVFCTGESGTGKEVVARLLHKRSKRRSRSFLKVNCAALPGELLESELFGYEQGAFTGAVRSKPGKFELCDKGTILLDEIAEVPPQLQAKLLHVLQDGEFTRLGGRSCIKVDVRVVAATNMDIRAALEAKKLREDLYYRLSTVVLEVPPLRERAADIPVLLRHLIEQHGGRNGLPVRSVSSRVLDFAQSREWPGNVRELENFAKRYLVLGEHALTGSGNEVLFAENGWKTPNGTEGPLCQRALKSVARTVKHDAESTAIRRALDQTNWNRKEAAKLLEISYKTLLEKLRLYQFDKRNGHHTS